MRGGYRPGSGRKKGTKDSKPRQPSAANEEAAKIRQMLAMGTKAKARIYQEYLVRIANQDRQQKPLSTVEKRLMDKIGDELAQEYAEPQPEAPVLDGTEPLAYMLKVMNDPKADQETRLRAASLAAPYIHPRKGEGAGKKEGKEDRAKEAGKGKFAPSRPPISVVK